MSSLTVNIQVVITIIGATVGPIAGVFFLGVFAPRANKHGAIVGFFVSSILMISISISYNIEKPYELYVLPMQTAPGTTSAMCPSGNFTAQIAEFYAQQSARHHYGTPDVIAVSRMSPFAYGLTGLFSNYIRISSVGSGVLTTFIVGLIVSLLWPYHMSAQKQLVAYACTYSGLDIPIPKAGTLDGQKELMPLNGDTKADTS